MKAGLDSSLLDSRCVSSEEMNDEKEYLLKRLISSLGGSSKGSGSLS